MKALVTVFLAFAPLIGPIREARAGYCDFEKYKAVIVDNPTEIDIVWTIARGSELEDEYVGEDPRWAAYARWVRTKTEWSAREIILNHVRVGEKLVEKLPEDDPFRRSVLRGNRNALLVASGNVGRIRRMSCLESLPLRELLKAVDLTKTGKEFHATVLRKDSTSKILFNFSKDTSDSQGGSESAAMKQLRQNLLSDGWRESSHLHNHPFAFDNPYGDVGGVLCPSEPDIALYRRERSSRALITNGIDTIELNKSEIGRFESGL